MNKLSKILISALLVLSLAACSSAPADSDTGKTEQASSAKDGTYTATSTGYGGEVIVGVTYADGKISDVELVDNNESLVVIERAFPIMRERIIEANGVDVDSVTGATFSSLAIKNAVADAMEQAGLEKPTVSTTNKEYEATTLEDVTTDIVVVGGGPSGLGAAITAKQANPELNVLIVEKMDILSGNGKFDLNFYDLINSKAQEETGNTYTIEKFKELKENAGDGEARLDAWANSEWTMDAWLRDMDITLDNNYSAMNHMATKDDYAGQLIQRQMEKTAHELGIEIKTGTQGVDLVFDGETVVGVSVLTNHNESYNIKAAKTIIATGGFSNNQDLLAEYAPEHTGFNTSNQIGATGDFVKVFEKYGFGFENMGKIRMIPLILLPSRDLTNNSAGTVLVNQDGVRFVNERNGELELANPIRDQKSVYMIVDTKKVEDHANVRKQVRTKTFKEFANLDEVAGFIGCDAQTLKDTFATYNENANSQTEDEFGLTPERAILEEGPYYVSLATSAVHMTKGGVTCNENAQVLYADGSVVDGLYASGEVTWQSGGYSQSVAFGRIAGQHAADSFAK